MYVIDFQSNHIEKHPSHFLKLVFAIFIKFFFPPNDSPSFPHFIDPKGQMEVE